MKSSMCAYKREERYFTSYHWCNECPPLDEYRALEKQHKLDWAKANKARNDAWKNKNARRIKHDKSLADKGF
jgi:hypothetical protein